MDRTDEMRALADVQARLQARFPDLDSEVVEAAVRLSHSKLTGRVRDFVPVLVEHAARDRLAFAAREGDNDTLRDIDPGAPPAPATTDPHGQSGD
ncbi:three-helix bundle dimerization domain-containing protein [Terrabacter sp. AAH1]